MTAESSGTARDQHGSPDLERALARLNSGAYDAAGTASALPDCDLILAIPRAERLHERRERAVVQNFGQVHEPAEALRMLEPEHPTQPPDQRVRRAFHLVLRGRSDRPFGHQ